MCMCLLCPAHVRLERLCDTRVEATQYVEEHGVQLEWAVLAQLLVFVWKIVLAVVVQQRLSSAHVLVDNDARVCYDDTDPEAEDNRTLKYFDGTIYFQGYPPKNSTETRLHVTDTKSVKSYDTEVYEKQLFYHNQVTRNKQKVQFGPYDNANERFISYDNAHARFVQGFLTYHLGGVSERQLNDRREPKFEHGKLRALLEEFKLLSVQS